MLSAIEFKDELLLGTTEICHVRPDFVLAAELEA